MIEIGYNRALHRFSLFVVFSTFILLIAGGLVTSTGSGLAVPDWPLSYGQLMPPMVGGIFYEHGHRMIATFVGFLTVVLSVWLWKKEQRRWVRFLGIGALVAVILQGILGGLTVKFRLPTAISVSHATLAQTFFCLVSSIALFTSSWWIGDPGNGLEKDRSVFGLTACTVACVYIQLILGALMRHTQAGLAVPDFPMAYGQFFPSLSTDALARYNTSQINDGLRLFADGPLTATQILIHMMHRLWAIVVLCLVSWTSWKLWKTFASVKRVRFLAVFLSLLVSCQIVLGAFTVLSRKGVDVTTAHVVAGSLVLVVSSLAMLHVAKIYRITLPSVILLFRRKAALA